MQQRDIAKHKKRLFESGLPQAFADLLTDLREQGLPQLNLTKGGDG